MGVWVDVPRRLPGVCRATGFADRSQGPFWEEDRPFTEVGDGRELTWYVSAPHLAAMCSEPGSPFRLVRLVDAQARDRYVADLEAEAVELRGRVAALADEVAELRAAPVVDVGRVADLVEERMSVVFARKTGPKRRSS